ncbi:unnamed protein product, partial [Symbiodinium necroappetens]
PDDPIGGRKSCPRHLDHCFNGETVVFGPQVCREMLYYGGPLRRHMVPWETILDIGRGAGSCDDRFADAAVRRLVARGREEGSVAK